jgi:hypothetical protein
MRRGVEFEAGGTRHTLRFDVNALCALEAEFGCTVEDVAKRLSPEQGMPRMTDIRAAFRAGLGVEGMTHVQAGEIMSEVGIHAAAQLIGEALGLAFPQPDAAATGEKPRGKPKAAA